MSPKRIMRFVGNRAEPEEELYGFEEILHHDRRWPVIDFSKVKDIPNPLYSGFESKPEIPGYLLKSLRPPEVSPEMWAYYGGPIPNFVYQTLDEVPKRAPVESPFEVNLTEALVGWRRWRLWGELLGSWNHFGNWPVDEALTSRCDICAEHVTPPYEHCSCGIYAADSMDDVPESVHQDSDVLGQVYGWGRYVRGEGGWRAQFAYPKSFHLGAHQGDLVEPLRKYHVPIFIDQPIRVYDPSEEGYEHREDDQSWNLGAGAESPAEEGEDYED